MLKAFKKTLRLKKNNRRKWSEQKDSPTGPSATACSPPLTDRLSSDEFSSAESCSSADFFSDIDSDSEFDTAHSTHDSLHPTLPLPKLEYTSAILSTHNNLVRSVVPAILDYVGDHFQPTPVLEVMLKQLFESSFHQVLFLEHYAQHPEGRKETLAEAIAREKRPLEEKSLMAANIQHSLLVWHIFTKLFLKHSHSKSFKRANEKERTEASFSYFAIAVLLGLKYNTDEIYDNVYYLELYNSLISPAIKLQDLNSLEKKYLDMLNWQISDLDFLSDIEIYALINQIEMRATNHEMNQLALSHTQDPYLPQQTAEKSDAAVPKSKVMNSGKHNHGRSKSL